MARQLLYNIVWVVFLRIDRKLLSNSQIRRRKAAQALYVYWERTNMNNCYWFHNVDLRVDPVQHLCRASPYIV